MAFKLLYITNQICGPGGLERVLSIKASRLAEDFGYDVHILTLDQNTSDLFYEFSAKIKYHNIETGNHPTKKGLHYLRGVNKVINRIKPDIISVCDDGLKGLLLPALLGKSCPMIYERHVSKKIEIKTENPSWFKRFITSLKFSLMDFGGKRYDAFVVLTEGNKKEWALKNIHVIPNPLSFYPGDNELSTLENKRVISVGKHSYQKGFDRLLKAWQIIQKKNPDWTLEIYGTIDESEGLEELAIKLEISNAVRFFKPVTNIAEKYKEASIYTMSSRFEGFGMVLTEAMAYGVPCISFDCPFGPGDIINNEVDGYLVANNDIESFAMKLMNLINDLPLRKALGDQARLSVSRYKPETIVTQWDSLFKSLIFQKS